ncbi:MAG: hypothetical protein G01um101419_97 [Parcubacteria group bacterium Gr01-1014_19]|nr:MAG: hypothetical protein G01um101419_97 [Parcubacteria group bacterium Gr01-1014_19]
MGIYSEISTEIAIQGFVREIEKELKENYKNPKVRIVLKKLGRFALTQFDYSAPDWAKKYKRLFK